jgi:PhnB protein
MCGPRYRGSMAKVHHAAPGAHTLSAYLSVRGAAEAIAWYKEIFGAEEISRMPMPDGRIGHAELRIGDAMFMLADEYPEIGLRSPLALGANSVSLMLYVPEVDKTYNRALAAGAKSRRAPQDQFWGDRMCTVVDPFGQRWMIATHVEDVTHEEMGRRMQEAMKQYEGA